MPMIDDKRRHRCYPHFAAMPVAGPNVGHICIRRQQPGHHGPIHARTVRDIGQHFDIADIAAFGEIGAEQGADDLRLPPFNPGPMDQAVRVQGIGRPLHRFEIEGEARSCGGLGHPGIGLHCLRLAAKLGFKITAPVRTIRWHVGVKLKRMPFNFKRMIAARFFNPGQCAVQIGFADIAPRADRVGNYVKLDQWSTSFTQTDGLIFGVA